MNTHRKDLIIAILVFVWFILILGFYYYRHKPITPDLALSFILTIYRLFICLGILSLSAGVGIRLISRSLRRTLGFYTLSTGLGFGIVGTVFYIGMRIFGVTPFLAWGTLILLLVLFWRESYEFWKFTVILFRRGLVAGFMGRMLALCCSLFFILELVSANAPSIKFDALVYHLALPLNYVIGGTGNYISTNMFWGMPQVTESFYTWAMLLGGAANGNIMGWSIGLLAFSSLFCLIAEMMGVRLAWVGLGALFGGMTIVQGLSWAYVEWALILMGSACLAALVNYSNNNKFRWAFLGGLLSGVAFGVKYTGAAILLPIVLAILSHAKKKNGFRIAILHLITVFAGFMITASPWLIKNLVATGNSLYPFLVPAGAMTKERLALYQGGAIDISWIDTILLPLQATIVGIEGGPGFSASIGPMLLVIGIFAWFRIHSENPKYKLFIRATSWLAIFGILIWMTAGRTSSLLSQTRLYAVFFPAFTVLSASGFNSLSKLNIPDVRFERVVGTVILLVIVLNLVQIAVIVTRSGAADFLVGGLSSRGYLERNLGWYSPAMDAIRALPPGSKILMLWEPRGYYCIPNCDSDEVIDRWRVDFNRYKNESSILDAWREAGYSHLLFHNSGAEFIRSDDDRYTQREWDVLGILLSKLLLEQEFGGVYTLYSVSP